MQKSLRVICYFILGGIFLTPFLALIVAGSLFFPFITGKNFSLRIITEIIFALWLILIIFDQKYRPKKTWLLIALFAFIIILSISTVFGANPFRSFWSNYERMEGLISYLHLFALFLVMTTMMDSNRIWKWFFNTSLFVSVIAAIYGLLQLGGKLAIHQGSTRLDATLGNASYFAIFMVIHVFLALVLFLKNKEWYRWFYLPVAFLDGIIVYYTATRGAILGMIGGFILGLILFVIFHPSKKIKMISFSLLAVLLIVVGGFLLVKDSSFIKNNPVLSRFSGISLSETTTQSRLIIWKMAWQGFKERPFFGWGPENFNLVFNKYYQASLWPQEPWFDRAHNVFLDHLVSSGLFGLLSYLGLFGFALYYLWKGKGENRIFSFTESAVLTSLFAAYFFHNLFVFDNLISSLLFFSILAYINSRVQKPSLVSLKTSQNSMKYAYSLVIGIVTIFLVYYLNVPAIGAGRTLIKALSISPLDQNGVNNVLADFQKVFDYHSFGTGEAREQLISFAIKIAVSPDAPSDLKQKVSDFAASEMKKMSDENSGDIRYMAFLANLYNRTGKTDQAIEILKEATALSPQKQQLYFELGNAYLNKSQVEDAFNVLKTSFELAPDYFDARQIYAVAAIFAGHDDIADELMKDYGGTIIADQRFVQAYFYRKEYDKIVAILQLFMKNDPNNGQYHVNLAATYLPMGNRSGAIEELQKAIEIEPKFNDQGEYYINEIRAGRNP